MRWNSLISNQGIHPVTGPEDKKTWLHLSQETGEGSAIMGRKKACPGRRATHTRVITAHAAHPPKKIAVLFLRERKENGYLESVPDKLSD